MMYASSGRIGPEEALMKKLYVVDLTQEEQATLLALTQKGSAPARKVRRANILLLANRTGENRSDTDIAPILHLGRATVERVRKRFVEEGLQGALSEKPRRGREPKLAGKPEAHLVAIACSQPPEGRGRWTLELLADRLVQMQVVETLSRETVRRTLKKTNSNPG